MFDYNGQSRGSGSDKPTAWLLVSPTLTVNTIQRRKAEWRTLGYVPLLLGLNRLPINAMSNERPLQPDVTLFDLACAPPVAGCALVIDEPAPQGIYRDPRLHRLLRQVLATEGSLRLGPATLGGLYRIGLGQLLRAAGDRVVVSMDHNMLPDVPVFVRRPNRRPRLSLVVGS